MIDLQALSDGMNSRMQRERAETQMTLGKLIAVLESMPPDSMVPNLNDAHSYRGYYCDLAFTLDDGTRTASSLLVECRAAMGEVFGGYKGGEFVMGALTPLWVSHYGVSSGTRIVGLTPNGELLTEQESGD
jgi:hypothetical protein